ncbi:hypothetical protein N7509_011157 [Penicillium cosmopolitanum]|uniref:Uncharacterized protein n=1 Tax=Penicillium cosmopolitanum TaxID=1131564 RepID=A0A9W9VSJ4_9EURO|nr:uncharacterized protein N7509_011157 [Penicillium cosmopolitanum]KAJ5388616.1 hypothetical protein N7509_011157 [Penicillium cosmopolitanum]
MVVASKKDAAKEPITGPEADLGTDEEKKKAAAQRAPTQAQMSTLLEKVAKAYGCNVIENTTSWLFDRNEIEGSKKIILSPGDGVRGDGIPEVGEVWGVEVGLSLGNGKVKNLDHRATLHRRTTTTYGLKRPSSRQTLSEIVKKFGTFPFSLRQLEDEKSAKVGVVECVRSGVVRQYEPAGSADNTPVSRLLTTVAITKNGLTKLATPNAVDLELYKSDKKIEDEEILKILEQPLPVLPVTRRTRARRRRPPAVKSKCIDLSVSCMSYAIYIDMMLDNFDPKTV